jgi:hypothetical protein
MSIHRWKFCEYGSYPACSNGSCLFFIESPGLSPFQRAALTVLQRRRIILGRKTEVADDRAPCIAIYIHKRVVSGVFVAGDTSIATCEQSFLKDTNFQLLHVHVYDSPLYYDSQSVYCFDQSPDDYFGIASRVLKKLVVNDVYDVVDAGEDHRYIRETERCERRMLCDRLSC